jgi:hypothetical protein
LKGNAGIGSVVMVVTILSHRGTGIGIACWPGVDGLGNEGLKLKLLVLTLVHTVERVDFVKMPGLCLRLVRAMRLLVFHLVVHEGVFGHL